MHFGDGCLLVQPPWLHLPNTAAQCANCWLLPARPWERRFRNLLCTFMLNAGRFLSNLRPPGPRCVHSPSWRRVTADCGCGPVLPETPAGALTGWSPLRCYCGDWWPRRRWPHWELARISLRGREREPERGQVNLNCLASRSLCAATIAGTHLLFDSDRGGLSKQRQWPVHCCYLSSLAKAIHCVHALT